MSDAPLPTERDLARSEEEEKLLRDIREEKERLWLDIQVRGQGVCCGTRTDQSI